MSNFISSLFASSYQSLSNNSQSSSQSIPGSFQEEPEANERNHFNSQSINGYLGKAFDIVEMIIFKPIIFIIYLFVRITAKLVNTIYFRDHFKRAIANNSSNDPIDKANRFIRVLEDDLPSNATLPDFYLGSYTQALYMATHKAKFLFVYLSNPENESSTSIFNKIIISPKFNSILKDPNVIIWGGDLTNPESYQLANSLNVTKFPFLGLLALTRSTTMSPDGPVKTSPKISLLVKIQGGIKDDVDSDALIENKFVKKMSKYGPELQLIRNELWESFFNQVMLKQQDLNYQKSLEQDRLKKKQKEAEKLMKEYLIYKLDYFKNLNPENIEDKARIGIKLPNGERITQLFPASSPVDDIFTYVQLYTNGYFDKTFENISNAERFEGFEPFFKFKLMSPLPPKVTLNDHLPNHTIIKDLNFIYPNGLLIIENIEDSSA
ncbi:UBX domain-containing protein 3 [[Candida] jaroonii]|uniref:UBX domain-containing protein 3 n=1 Tax=[Candida] jaroonii TaxID=467808 RepID=A0ACA9YDE7_9ASCO|nr:UBX domain-containing protein 3 [[Candida] jaroonii]